MTDLSHDADEGFHEIQLSGKQLVFLFMATTVVSVVIFLCGVLVGRGVKGDTLNAAESPSAAAQPATVTPPPDAPPPTIDPPAGTADRLTYSRRLEGSKPVAEELKPAAEPPNSTKSDPPPAPAAEREKPAETAPVPADPKVSTPPAQTSKPAAGPATASAQGARPGAWAVQVVALSDRGAANAVVQRLMGKGYPAFVLAPQAGAPVQHYKVQVGRFPDRSEAEQVKTRLKKEEQFEPIIVR
jgi:cell division septation protein DedD